MTEQTTWADDQAFIEELKGKGGVVINGVRHTASTFLDDAFERGRNRENLDAQFYRDALREIAKFLGYDDYRQNPHAVAQFVEWMRLSTSNAVLRSTQRAELAERKLKEQMDLALQVRNLLWQGRPGQPGLTTPKDIAAIVDGVRVVVESLKSYDDDRNAVRRDNAGLRGENAGLRMRANVAEQRASDMQMQVDAMKEALAGERERGYQAALADVRRAAKQLREDRS